MENLHTFKEVSALKKLREEYERQLQMIGIELCDLPDECMAKLNECVQLKIAIKLHSLGMNYLQEFYFTQKKEQIDHILTVAKIEKDISDLEEEIATETVELDQLQNFTTSVNKGLMSETEKENTKASIVKKMKDLVERQKTFTIPEDINIDELINKLEILEKRNMNGRNT